MPTGGQPTKFTKETKRQALFLASKHFTDKEISECIGVKEQTLNNWKKAHPKFFESLKREKKIADSAVVRSLYERAVGYSHPEDKIFNNNGKPLIVKTIKHYPPDPTSMIFWLKNRQSDDWADKREFEGKLNIEDIINAITG